VQRRVCVLLIDKGKDCTELVTAGDKWNVRMKNIGRSEVVSRTRRRVLQSNEERK